MNALSTLICGKILTVLISELKVTYTNVFINAEFWISMQRQKLTLRPHTQTHPKTNLNAGIKNINCV
jgi:hypothetical protein